MSTTPVDQHLEELPALSTVSAGTIIYAVSAPGDESYQLSVSILFTSPQFTGNPTAPTQLGTDNSTKLATTAFVKGQTSGLQPGNLLLTQISSLGDPGADELIFWDDSAGAITYLSLAASLSITGTVLSVNSAAVTGVVHTTGNEVISGTKIFANPIVGTITGSITTAQVTGLSTVLASKQPLDNTLLALASLNITPNTLIYGTGTDTFALSTLTPFMRTLLDDVDAATARATLGITPTGFEPVEVVGDRDTDEWRMSLSAALVELNLIIDHSTSGSTVTTTTAPPETTTASPNVLPSNLAFPINVVMTKSTPTFTSDTTCDLSGVAGWTIGASFLVTDDEWLVVLNPPAAATPPSGATGPLYITEGVTGSTVATIAVNTPTLTITPTSGPPGITPLLTATGTSTVWMTATGTGLLGVTGGIGSSISNATVTTDTDATAVLTVGSESGSLVIRDNSTGATAIFTVTALVTGRDSMSEPAAGVYLTDHIPSGTGALGGPWIDASNTGNKFISLASGAGFTAPAGVIVCAAQAGITTGSNNYSQLLVKGLAATFDCGPGLFDKNTLGVAAEPRAYVMVIWMGAFQLMRIGGGAYNAVGTVTGAPTFVAGTNYLLRIERDVVDWTTCVIRGYVNGVQVVSWTDTAAYGDGVFSAGSQAPGIFAYQADVCTITNYEAGTIGPPITSSVSPGSFPANHYGYVNAVLTKSTPTISPATIFVVSGVAGWSLIGYGSFTPTQFNLEILGPSYATPPAGATGTLLVTEQRSGDTVATVVVGTPTFTLSPSSAHPGDTITLTAIGTFTIWTQPITGDLLSLSSGGVGAALGSSTIGSDSAATVVLTAGTASDVLTILDRSTGATASFTVAAFINGKDSLAEPTAGAHLTDHVPSGPGAVGGPWTDASTTGNQFTSVAGGAGFVGIAGGPTYAIQAKIKTSSDNYAQVNIKATAGGFYGGAQLYNDGTVDGYAMFYAVSAFRLVKLYSGGALADIATVTGAPTFTPGTNYLLGVKRNVIDANNCTVTGYINGVQVASGVDTSATSGGEIWSSGQSPGIFAYLGDVCTFSLFETGSDYRLKPAAALAHFIPAASLPVNTNARAVIPLTEGTGLPVEFAGAVTATPSVGVDGLGVNPPTWVAGDFGSALRFAADSQQLDFVGRGNNAAGGNSTLAVVFRPVAYSASGYSLLISSGWGIYTAFYGVGVVDPDGNTQGPPSGFPSLVFGHWHLLVVATDLSAGTATWYFYDFDAASPSLFTGSNAWFHAPDGANFTINARNGGNWYFLGDISHAALWSGVLISPGQVNQLIADTAVQVRGKLTSTTTSLAAGASGVVVPLVGNAGIWTPGTPGSPTFTVWSTGTGASKTAQTVSGVNGASVTLTNGTAGILTITDPSTGATLSLIVS